MLMYPITKENMKAIEIKPVAVWVAIDPPKETFAIMSAPMVPIRDRKMII